MTVAELISVLGVTRRSQKRRLAKLCPVDQDSGKVTVLFHIDNIYVDAIFKLDSISVAAIDGIKREFIAWIEELEKQIKDKALRLCSLNISVVETPKFAFFQYESNMTPAQLANQEPSMNRFEKILLDYMKNNASVIFNRWFILTLVDGKIAVINTPMGIYRVTELSKPSIAAETNQQRLVKAGLEGRAPKGNFATKIFSSGNKIKRQPPPNKVVSLQRKEGRPLAEQGQVVPATAEVKRDGGK